MQFALFFMSFLFSFVVSLAAAVPTLKFTNLTPDAICYKVELSFGHVATNAICDFDKGIRVDGGHNLTHVVHPSPDFVGAITAMTMGGFKGTRHELNFAAPASPGCPSANCTWYDVDFEMGMSNSTLGPIDHRNLTNGQASVAGDANILQKSNDAWVQITEQHRALLRPHYYYLDHRTPSGNLSVVRMDKKRPHEVMEFFQMHANLTGYVGAGSIKDVVVDPQSKEAQIVGTQDKFSWEVDTQQMEIIAY